MTSNVKPHNFLDTNALARFIYSVAHHRIRGRKTSLRILLEQDLMRITTGYPQYSRSIELIREGRLHTKAFKLELHEIEKVVEEAFRIALNKWLVVVDPNDVQFFDGVELELYRRLSHSWQSLLGNVDREDQEMLQYAALAYTCYSFIKTSIKTSQGRYTPTYMNLVSGDVYVGAVAEKLDRVLKSILEDMRG